MGKLNKCIMPEMPYCPCCSESYIEHIFHSYNDIETKWHCLIPNDKETFEEFIMDRFTRID